jgi:hypothetical protein
MRTDLDAFSDLEASSMMLAGYRIAREVVTPNAPPRPGEEDRWRFGSVAGRLDDPDPAYLRRLWIARLSFFKPLALAVAPGARERPNRAPRASRIALGIVAAILVAAGVFLAGQALTGSSVPAPALYGVLVGGLAAFVLYLKADVPGLRTLSWLLYDTVVPFMLALLGVFSIASLGFVLEGWVHRGLGGEDGVRPWVRKVARALAVRWVPAVVVVAGIAVAGLAALLLILDCAINVPRSLNELVLFPRLIAAMIGGAIAAVAAGAIEARFDRHRDLSRAVATGFGIVATGVGLVLAVWVAAKVLALFGQRGEAPQSVPAAYGTLAVIAIVAGAITFGAMTASLRLVAHFRRAEAETLPLGVMSVGLVAVALFIALRTVPTTDEKVRSGGRADLIAKSGRPDVRYDTMLVVDSSDRAGRQLISRARHDPTSLLRPRTDGLRSDTAFGLAVVTAAPSGWLVLAQPSSDRGRLVAALANVESAIGARGPGAYAPALRGLFRGPTVGWRKDAVRSVAIVSDRPPSRTQLRNGNTAPPGVPGVIQEIASNPPVDSKQLPPPGGVVLNLIASQRTPAAAHLDWTEWTTRTGGMVVSHRASASPLDEAEDAVTRAPSPDEQQQAMAYRPLLLFDGKERRPPLDVDAFLAERAHALCHPATVDYDCNPVDAGLELATDPTNHDAVLRVNAHPGAPDEFQRDTSQRIYYHLTYDRQRDVRYFDYWVFYRFNDSPRLNGLTCLPGLAIAEATCFDHEGDWEGITVTVPGRRGTPSPDSVAYAGHSWVYGFRWDALVAAGASAGSTHPKVWVARGSHASYPMACGKAARTSCRQLKSDIPDGSRDGAKPWLNNVDAACQRDHCVAPLPLTRAGGPASWSAFGGGWGMPRCTVGLKLCVRARGPRSPYFQNRYAKPGDAPLADYLLRRSRTP